MDNLDARCGQSSGEAGRQVRVYFHGGQLRHEDSQHIGRQPWSGSHFEKVVAEGAGTDHPRKKFVLDLGCPLWARQVLEMFLVHAVRATRDRVGGQGWPAVAATLPSDLPRCVNPGWAVRGVSVGLVWGPQPGDPQERVVIAITTTIASPEVWFSWRSRLA